MHEGIFAHFKTEKGNIKVQLTFDKTPGTVGNFVGLVEGSIENKVSPKGTPYYDGLKFHRVISDFMIQGGCPQGTGVGGPGYQFDDEFHPELKHDRSGTLSMANAGPGTNGSQFFITHSATPWLDGKHTVFGHLVEGQKVVDAIAQDDTIQNIIIERVGKDAVAWDAVSAFDVFINEKETHVKAAQEAAAKELEALLNGEADSNDTFLEVHSGAGGTESCDWASMLARMYLRWSEKAGYKIEMQSETPGEEAGIKSVTYKISGQNAYGWLKSESGVHRLVRISPFDSAAKRHTSFCSVWVYPVVDDNIDIEVNPADIRIDTYRSSGAGGQHVNTTDSAVRITHHPTGIVVTSSEKSQHQNRDIAMKALKSRLYQMELDRRNSAINEAHENKGDAGWGNQIRSYVLQPYQMVKDLRTGHETSDTKGVLDGDLDAFMAATLAQDVSGKSRAEASDLD